MNSTDGYFQSTRYNNTITNRISNIYFDILYGVLRSIYTKIDTAVYNTQDIFGYISTTW